jgi:hypothetical protein
LLKGESRAPMLQVAGPRRRRQAVERRRHVAGIVSGIGHHPGVSVSGIADDKRKGLALGGRAGSTGRYVQHGGMSAA